MLKKGILMLLLGIFVFLLAGCETVKGAAEGAKSDLESLKKADEWQRKNLW